VALDALVARAVSVERRAILLADWQTSSLTRRDRPPMAKAKRTTHRSTAGKKLYAKRDSAGKFKDIQTYERAHRADLAKKSGAEKATAAKKAKKAAAKKAVKKAKKAKKAAKKR